MLEMNHQVLIWTLEDDPGLRFVYDEILGFRYRLRQFETLASFENAIESLPPSYPDLLIADVRLSDGNFLNLLASRQGAKVKRIPFLVVSLIDDLDALRLAFDEGAIDYLTKPFGRGELIVKVERILSQRTILYEPDVEMDEQDGFYVDPTSLRVFRGSRCSNPLTSKEYQIFHLLSSESSNSVARNEIISRVWGKVSVTSKTLDVHLFNLRRKLAPLAMDVYRTAPNSYRLLSLSSSSGLVGDEPRLI